MDLVPYGTPQDRPDAELQTAIRSLESVLSDDERVQLRNQGLPHATAALNLTTRIDRQCGLQRRQCLGTRLTTVLESVQQFSTVADTFINAHPEVAALVWGAVKFSLLVIQGRTCSVLLRRLLTIQQLISNYTSYFERLSHLFMKVGRDCPKYTQFGALYPSSSKLQKALCDYYAVIVRLCKHAVDSLRQPSK